MTHDTKAGERSTGERSEQSPSSVSRVSRATDVFSGFVPPILSKKIPRGARPPGTAASGRATSKASPAPAPSAPKAIVPKNPLHGYAPLDRVTYVGTQFCPECGQTSRHVAGDLIRFIHTASGGLQTKRTRAYAAADARWSDLKRTVEYLTPTECVCPSCLGLDQTYDLAASGRGQLPLL